MIISTIKWPPSILVNRFRRGLEEAFWSLCLNVKQAPWEWGGRPPKEVDGALAKEPRECVQVLPCPPHWVIPDKSQPWIPYL